MAWTIADGDWLDRSFELTAVIILGGHYRLRDDHGTREHRHARRPRPITEDSRLPNRLEIALIITRAWISARVGRCPVRHTAASPPVPTYSTLAPGCSSDADLAHLFQCLGANLVRAST
jgi:hypothetical protein